MFYRWLIGFPAILLPLFLGGVRPWFWSAVGSFFFIGLGILLWVEKSETIRELFSKKRAWLLGLFPLYALFQALPLPLSWLALLSPHRLFWIRGAEANAELSFSMASISYAPIESLSRGIWWLFLLCYGLCLYHFLQDKRHYSWFFRLLLVFAALEAFYGLLQVLFPPLGVLWEQNTPLGDAGRGYARGTFINRNHFAAFMGLIWPVLLAHLLSLRDDSEDGKQPARSLPFSKREALWQIRQQQILMTVLVGFVILSLIFSQSRGGIIGSLIALSLFIILAGIRHKKAVVFVSGCWLVMFFYGSLLGFDAILERFNYLSEGYISRFMLWKDTFSIIQDHPLTGIGLGSYTIVCPVYQTAVSDMEWIGHAHNDYLELTSELGFPITILLIGILWTYWWKKAISLWCSRKVLPRHDRLMRAGSLAGMAAFLTHSWAEFNWQMPANQLYFVILLVLSFGSLHHSDQDQLPRLIRGKTSPSNHLKSALSLFN